MQLVRKTVIVTIPDIQRLKAEWVLDKNQLRQLRSLGFRTYANGDKRKAFLPCFTTEDAAAIQLLIMKICLEVFYFKQFEGQAQIKYVEPDSLA
ncbi:hypothetical protein [Hymenobacter psychrotolerans]|uniref:Uncharacterized protein n=1 Tax=Hymenobacter psychrotolerans DSM 18569 TaxID=1121959 RepID=A0A1M6UTK8_9BACT|nr:hypothetical protein [Hymenobacter psychrotolerans]SHK72483.1 hypothetical protein SAMN02746009_01473 [Hymenobacter psychrotolerans DSM 18569]